MKTMQEDIFGIVMLWTGLVFSLSILIAGGLAWARTEYWQFVLFGPISAVCACTCAYCASKKNNNGPDRMGNGTESENSEHPFATK